MAETDNGSHEPTGGARLRALMSDGLVIAPGCYDALSAMLVQRAGFSAAYLSGFALSASLLGAPDLGLISLDDIVDAVRHVTAVVTIPLIADIDTGFGGPLNIRRTVAEVEAAGAAAVQIEDQVSPKRCGHFEDKSIVDIDEAVALERVAAALGGSPLLYNAVEGGRSPILPAAALAAHGVRILIHPVTLLLESIHSQQAALTALRGGHQATNQSIALAREVVGVDDAISFHNRAGRTS